MAPNFKAAEAARSEVISILRTWSEPMTEGASTTLSNAVTLAVAGRHAQITGYHLLKALIAPDVPSKTLMYSAITIVGGDPEVIRTAVEHIVTRCLPPLPSGYTHGTIEKYPIYKCLKCAIELRDKAGDAVISTPHLISSLLVDRDVYTLFKTHNIKLEDIPAAIERLYREAGSVNSKPGIGKTPASGASTPEDALKEFVVDLTELAEQGKIDPVVGRDSEIRRVIRILCRRSKNNPVLIGEPGVGKTSIAEGLALRIARKEVPPTLCSKLWSLDFGAIRAGASHKGQFEERIQKVLKAISESAESGQGMILFLDEMHLMMASGSGEIDAANLFKPLLARGKLRCIGATTLAEYSRHIEKDAALERRFTQIIVKEPNVAETITILRGIKEKYEVHHGVRIMDSAVVAAAELAKRYITARRLPDSAIDLVDECCANLRATRDTVPEEIEALQRKKVELEVESHGLKREADKDRDAKERYRKVKQQLAGIKDQLQPLYAAWQTEQKASQEVAQAKQEIDQLKSKSAEAERNNNLDEAFKLKYTLLPEAEKKLKHLEEVLNRDDSSGLQRLTISDCVTAEAVAEAVGKWTGIPVSRLLSSEKEKLLRMEMILGKHVVGQPEAVEAVANAIRLSRSGLSNASRPIASFLLAGPSGTGKTLLSKTLATILFDSPDAMLRIDASEYTEKHAVSRLVGAPPGYKGFGEGGQLTDYVRRKPFCIVLIDEIEKAAKEFTTLFLQVLDDGRLTDSQGRTIDFRNTVIIMTSNLGAHHLVGMSDGPPSPGRRANVLNSIEGHFLPEFVNRIDEIVIFRALSRESMIDIVDNRLKEVEDRLAAKKMTLAIDHKSKQYLAENGYSPQYGARPLGRLIQKDILQPLSRTILEERIKDGETVRVIYDPGYRKPVIIANHSLKTSLKNNLDVEEEAKWVAGGGATVS